MIWLAIACSGPGAMAVIESNETFAFNMFLGAAVVGLLVASYAAVKRRATVWLWLTIALAVLHPSNWMGARSGDCGTMLYFASVAVSVLSLLFATLAVFTVRRGTREPAA